MELQAPPVYALQLTNSPASDDNTPAYATPPPTYTEASPGHTTASSYAPPPHYDAHWAFRAPYDRSTEQICDTSLATSTQTLSALRSAVDTASAPSSQLSSGAIIRQSATSAYLSDYLWWSVASLIIWFWPLGLAAVIYSVRARRAASRAEAARFASIAKRLNLSATLIGPTVFLAAVVGLIVVDVRTTESSKGAYQSTTSWFASNAVEITFAAYIYSARTTEPAEGPAASTSPATER